MSYQNNGMIHKKNHPWLIWGVLITVALVCVIGLILILRGNKTVKTSADPEGVKAVQAKLPASAVKDMTASQFMEGDAHWNWWDEYRDKADASAKLQPELTACYQTIMRQLLADEKENTVCSPLNIYIALSMLAEVSDGSTRQQILDVLNVSDILSLRKQIGVLWDGNYVDTPVLQCLLANSLWLRDSDIYNEKTLQLLADQYYASSFRGEPGSEDMDRALQDWTNEATCHLLEDYVKDLKLDADTVLALVSTLYYKAAWTDNFWASATDQQVFHGLEGDTTVDMMHKADTMRVHRADQFTSVGLDLMDSGAMYFFLPSDGIDVDQLLQDPEIFTAILGGNDDDWYVPLVHLSIPKFDIAAKMDLRENLKEMGITDAFVPGLADFSPLTTKIEDIYVSKAEHAATVKINEEGVVGAAYTELAMAEGAALPEDEIDFTVDRPFLFIIAGRDGSILFAGIVRNLP
ncbi:MAG: serpin family protein [Firmicutes bacterium]|nr:serpin family protein [Bacillota bacterium]